MKIRYFVCYEVTEKNESFIDSDFFDIDYRIDSKASLRSLCKLIRDDYGADSKRITIISWQEVKNELQKM